MPENVRRLDSAPSAQTHARQQEQHQREEAQRREARAQRIAAELDNSGIFVIDCGDDEAKREEARQDGRRAGRILHRSIRTRVLPDGRVAVWDVQHADNPLRTRLDERRANKRLGQALSDGGFHLPGITGPHDDSST